jgi:Domain of unknown function (DUF5666)
MKRLLIALVAIAFISAVAYAHNGMEHVMGTVTAITNTSIEVNTTAGKSQTVALADTTRYSKMDQTIKIKDIKVGDHVVIHATRKGTILTAATVEIGTSAAKPHASTPSE